MFKTNDLIVGYVVPLAIRALAKYGESINWELVKQTLKDRLPGLIPGELLDAPAIAFAERLIDTMGIAMCNVSALESVTSLCLAKDYLGAMKALYVLISGEKQ